MTRKERYRRVIEYFIAHRPVAETELVYASPYELLVAVILSAQCTDKRVNLLTPAFFERFPDADTLAASSEDEVFSFIKSCSYPNNKAKHLVGMARMLVSEFNGVVPDDITALQRLPGVGRKTANVVASVVFGLPAMAVDTHVFRVSARIGLTHQAKTPLEAERQLVANIPADKLHIAHHWLILHGRYICQARKPLCEDCGLQEFCRFYSDRISKKSSQIV